MLDEAHVAATPGVDFDPVNGRQVIRFCYAGSREDARAAVERVGRWLKLDAMRQAARPWLHWQREP